MDEVIMRITRMEQCFDTLRAAAACTPAQLGSDAALREQLAALAAYYEGGQWLRDYELDEQGLLPQTLKRGVLAQDAVYDFLNELHFDKEDHHEI